MIANIKHKISYYLLRSRFSAVEFLSRWSFFLFVFFAKKYFTNLSSPKVFSSRRAVLLAVSTRRDFLKVREVIFIKKERKKVFNLAKA